jgi:uncharacterized protein YggL (DUF469 family)
MITLATDLVQQFYTHQQICDNQVVQIISKNKLLNHFLDEIISKGKFFFYGGGIKTTVSYTHTHTGSKVVLTFRSKNSKIDSE